MKYAFKTQRNIRIHLSAAILAVMLSWLLEVSAGDFALVILAISLVLFAEMVNTAVEKTVDLFMSTYHPLAKIAKNVAAGAVLITAISAVVIGIIVFAKPLVEIFSSL